VSVSVVNGYLCYSSCDAAKARAGRDPHPKPDTAQAPPRTPGTPAVTFGGSLTALNDANPGDAAASVTGAASAQRPAIDILA
jgi:hypothetical protein